MRAGYQAICIAVAMIGGTVVALSLGVGDPPHSIAGAALAPRSYDGCDLSEQQIREIWVLLRVQNKTAGRSEAEGARLAAQLISESEADCHASKRAIPTALPPELQRR